MTTDSPDADVKPEGNAPEEHVESFAETALKLGGKSEEEARRTGAIDSADDNVEKLFKPQYQTVNSPAHRAVWDREMPIDVFRSSPSEAPADVRKVMDQSINTVQLIYILCQIHTNSTKLHNGLLLIL